MDYEARREGGDFSDSPPVADLDEALVLDECKSGKRLLKRRATAAATTTTTGKRVNLRLHLCHHKFVLGESGIEILRALVEHCNLSGDAVNDCQ